MDVSCPRCQTEYDFDEARIPDDGVTVKCTQCGHVFRVKRRAAEATLPPPPVPREWKIRRRASGTTSTCRELTTLQQWIVEGKVLRDDEISLTGETWKRLGDIPELASFFQVVDDAAKGRALRSPSLVPPPPPAPSVPPNTSITETWREPQFKTPAPPALPPPPTGDSPFASSPSSAGLTNLSAELRASGRRRNLPVADDADLQRAIQGSGRKWPLFIAIGLLAGAAAGWFFGIYQPEVERKQAAHLAEEQARAREEEAKKAAEAAALAKAQAAAAAVAAPAVVDAGVSPAATPVVTDAGAPASPVDAGAVVASAAPVEKKPEPKLDFQSLLDRGYSQLAQDKPEAALNTFGRAIDLRPESVEAVSGRGLALLDLGNPAAAQAAFEQAVKLNARFGPGIMGLAESLRTQGKDERAIEWYQKYLDVLPEGSEANVARNNIERLKKK